MEKQDKSANRHHSPQEGRFGDTMDMSNEMENQDNSDVRRHFFDGDFPDIWYDMPFPHETDESGQILGLATLGETDIRYKWPDSAWYHADLREPDKTYTVDRTVLYTIFCTDHRTGHKRTVYGHVTENVVHDYALAYVDEYHSVEVKRYNPDNEE
jgi:hypothetical protein